MTPDDEKELWRVLRRMERRQSIVGGIVTGIAIVGGIYVWYHDSLQSHGVIDDLLPWLPFFVVFLLPTSWDGSDEPTKRHYWRK
jgi:hypothetical protein